MAQSGAELKESHRAYNIEVLAKLIETYKKADVKTKDVASLLKHLMLRPGLLGSDYGASVTQTSRAVSKIGPANKTLPVQLQASILEFAGTTTPMDKLKEMFQPAAWPYIKAQLDAWTKEMSERLETARKLHRDELPKLQEKFKQWQANSG